MTQVTKPFPNFTPDIAHAVLRAGFQGIGVEFGPTKLAPGEVREFKHGVMTVRVQLEQGGLPYLAISTPNSQTDVLELRFKRNKMREYLPARIKEAEGRIPADLSSIDAQIIVARIAEVANPFMDEMRQRLHDELRPLPVLDF